MDLAIDFWVPVYIYNLLLSDSFRLWDKISSCAKDGLVALMKTVVETYVLEVGNQFVQNFEVLLSVVIKSDFSSFLVFVPIFCLSKLLLRCVGDLKTLAKTFLTDYLNSKVFFFFFEKPIVFGDLN